MPASFDATNPPFDKLSASEIDTLKAALDIEYFAPGAAIIEAGSSAEFLYVIIKGTVEEKAGDEAESVLGPQESFDARALVHGASGLAFVAAEETLCHTIPKQVVLDLIRDNPAFAAFFYSEISRKLDAMVQDAGAEGMDSVLRARIGDAHIHPAAFIDGSATIEVAGHKMAEADCNALFVRDGGRIGIVTGMNLSKAVVLKRKPLDTPVRDVCRFDLVSVNRDGFVFDALLLMTKHNKRRLVVREGDKFTGTIEDIDILGLFAGNSQLIPGRIDRARSIDDLAEAAGDIQAQVGRLHKQGVKVEDIAEVTSDLNRRLFARLFEMTAPEDILEHGCLMIMGSEGRGEQTVRTDQDNGLLLAKPIAEATIQHFRDDFTAALERFGFPPCPGNVMVRNPVWSQSVDYFTKQVTRWIISPDEMSAMHLGIFADAIAIGRNRELLTRAKSAFFDMMRGESAYLSQFARAIDQFPGAGGVFTALMATVGREEVIDIKKSGIFPIVHGIRTMAIERGIFETSTVKRIEQIESEGIFALSFAQELTGAFRFFLELRLRSQIKAQRLGDLAAESLVKPGELSNVERDLLRDALRVVKEFREIVRSRYHLGLF